jgi:hypothetical protein
MTVTTRRMLALCLPPLLAGLLDMAVTLHGQSAAYWAGDYAQVNEMSGTLRSWLQMSPIAFLGGAIGLVILFLAILYLLPDTLALIFVIALTIGSCNGASTWLWRHPYGYQISNLIFLAAAIALTFSIRFVWRARAPQEHQPSLPGIYRWPLLALLLGIALYVGFRT